MAEHPCYTVDVKRNPGCGKVKTEEITMKKMKLFAALMGGVMALGAMGTAMAAHNAAPAAKPKAVKIVQTAGRDQLGDFAPDFARYNDDILFGEVWSKNDVLSLHDRSLVTISALVASGITDSSLKYHIQTAKKNGVTKEEMAAMLTQVAFYGGWPKAWAAFRYAKEVYAEQK
jgi:4-carboxymuconolactone decarboxylase